jgi:hypothetical protein
MLNKYIVIDNCIKIASNYNGKVFGGYLRDVIIPKTIKHMDQCSFKDVDFWFKNSHDSDSFIDQISDIYNFKVQHQSSVDNNLPYKFNRKQYYLYINNYCLLFDIIISELFPVDDFNVNFLTYSYKNDKELIECQSKLFEKDELINYIYQKQMIILPTYIKRLLNDKSHINRVDRFIHGGWTIKYENVHFPNPLTKSWLAETFQCNENDSIYNKQDTIIHF